MTQKLSNEEIAKRLTPYKITLVGKYIDIHTQTQFKCFCGNIFDAIPKHILRNSTKSCGCRIPAKTPKPGQNLAEKRPDIAKEWHTTKNNQGPSSINYGSSKKYWWICPNHHEYQASIKHRVINNTGCPYCKGKSVQIGYNDLNTTNPLIADSWDYSKNTIQPTQITSNSGKLIWWKCHKCNNGWKSTVSNRSKGKGCPFCAGKKVDAGLNDVATTHPQLLNEWDFAKNIIKPTEISFGSHKKIWWICAQCNHSWATAIHSRTKLKSGCPKCVSSLGEKRIEEILTQYSIEYHKEIRFEKCKNIRTLPFDFYLPIYNSCIEFNGAQHYKLCTGYFNDVKQFKGIQKRDKIKVKYCKKNNIKLIVIPYTDFDRIEDILIKELNLGDVVVDVKKDS